MKKVAYFLSDLHLGADAQLDDFDSDIAITEFVQKICADDKDAEVDLVLLGDTFDLWQVVPEEDKTQPTADLIHLDIDPAGEAAKTERAAMRHPQVFTAFRTFLGSADVGRRLVCVQGNHDHSLIDTAPQEAFRDKVNTYHTLRPRIVFGGCYDNPDLRVYGEHGNQYDGQNNAYGNFQILAECPGYHFVRLFWNRMEPQAPEFNRLYPNQWHRTFRWLLQKRRWDLVGSALRFFRQYRKDRRVPQYIDVPGVPFLLTQEGGAPHPFEDLPELLFRSEPPSAGSIFSQNATVESTYRRLYATDSEFRRVMDSYFMETFRALPAVGPPSAPADAVEPYGVAGGRDRYLSAIQVMFADHDNPKHPYFRARPLEPESYDYVIFGHTHEKRQDAIPHQQGKIYFNTGTWVTRVDPRGEPAYCRTYVRLERGDGNSVKAFSADWQ